MCRCSENSDLFENPVTLSEYVFVLMPGVGYGAASVCPQPLTMSRALARA